MAKVSPVRRINKEDFSQEDQQLIERLSTLLNASLEEIVNVINGNLSVNDNLNENVVTVDVEVDANGFPKVDTNFRITLKTRCRGLSVIRVEDLSGTGSYASGTPFITFSEGNTGIISIRHVAGIPANKKFRLSVRATG